MRAVKTEYICYVAAEQEGLYYNRASMHISSYIDFYTPCMACMPYTIYEPEAGVAG